MAEGPGGDETEDKRERGHCFGKKLRGISNVCWTQKGEGMDYGLCFQLLFAFQVRPLETPQSIIESNYNLKDILILGEQYFLYI